MGSLRPITAAKPVELEFRATLAEELIDEIIDEEGLRPSEEWAFTFDLKEVESPELRKRLREAYERYMNVASFPVVRRLAGDPGDFLEEIEPWLGEVEKAEAKAEKEAEKSEAAEAELLKAFAEEMVSWVVEHGSQRLRLAVERGYRSNTTYAFERVEHEMPGFWVDSADDCDWGERVDPSEEALLLEQSTKKQLTEIDPSLEVEIVWLTETPRALDRKMEAEGLEFDPQEALIVPGYLDRYLLVMPLAVELRRDPEREGPEEGED